jgi:glycosyltransferase involved in cell wall biosynthesis
MATFNGAKYLQEQLNSFVNQTSLPDELIICDDGSEDGTISIIEEFRQSAPFPVRIIKNTRNYGYIRNFEQALTLCSGNLIFLSDQDDIWFPEKISYIERIFREDIGKLLIIHDGKLVDERLQWYGATKLKQVRAGWNNDKHFITGALSALHKDLISCVLPFPNNITIGHDAWIHLIASLLGARGIIEKPLQLIRRHSTNTSVWVGSSTHQISSLSVIRSNFNTQASTSYQNRIDLNESLQNRLVQIQCNELNKFSAETICCSLNYLRDERIALEARAAILGAGFFMRKYKALRMLLRNDYIFFNGFMSFIRDVVR